MSVIENRQKLVLIGNGKAGMNTIEQIIRLVPDSIR